MKKFSFIIIGLLLSFATSLRAADVIGAGSSFVYPLMARWAALYKQETGHEINYQSIGSGGGLSQLKQQTIDFAAVDMPQSVETLKENHWIQFPLASGGLVISANIPGIANNSLRLTGPVLAKIFLGQITRWDDPAIKMINPNIKLPHFSIVVIHRADGSGTTYNFSYYLSIISAEWAKEVGYSTEVNWPTGIGAKGNTGVAMFTQRIPGSIGYIEYSYVRLTGLSTVQLQNAAGKFISPTPQSFQAAAEKVHWDSATAFNQLIINQSGDDSWPIVATTFALLPLSSKANTQIISFFNWGYIKKRDVTTDLDYLPLSTDLIRLIQHNWQQYLNIRVSE